MPKDFLEEDFYKAAADGPPFVVSDGHGAQTLTFDTHDEARVAACALNIAFARGALRAFTVAFTPEQLAEAGVI